MTTAPGNPFDKWNFLSRICVAYDTSHTTYILEYGRRNMGLDPMRIAGSLWLGIGLLWLISALSTKSTVQRQPANSRAVHGILAVIGFFLVFDDHLGVPLLNTRFVPPAPAIEIAGLALTAVGLAFAIWARLHLGRNWSSAVTIKQDHTLMRHGPYAIVRHPIYSGLLLGIVGTALVYGAVRCLLGLPFIAAAFVYKLRIEESFMTQQFGAEYAAYKRNVKALVPLVF